MVASTLVEVKGAVIEQAQMSLLFQPLNPRYDRISKCLFQGKNVWLPKSVVTILDNGHITLPRDLAIQKELI